MRDADWQKRAAYWRRRRMRLFVSAGICAFLATLCIWPAIGGWRRERSLAVAIDAAGTTSPAVQAELRGFFMERANVQALKWGFGALLLAGVAGLLLLAARDSRRNAWAAEGCCWQCGYPLAGLPQPRCPECGRWAEVSAIPPPRD